MDRWAIGWISGLLDVRIIGQMEEIIDGWMKTLVTI